MRSDESKKEITLDDIRQLMADNIMENGHDKNTFDHCCYWSIVFDESLHSYADRLTKFIEVNKLQLLPQSESFKFFRVSEMLRYKMELAVLSQSNKLTLEQERLDREKEDFFWVEPETNFCCDNTI